MLHWILAVGIVWGWLMLATLVPLSSNVPDDSWANNLAYVLSIVLIFGQICFVDRCAA